MSKKIVVIGGVACGGKTAARLRRLDPEAEILILEKGPYLSYAGCGLPYYIEGIVKEYKELMCTPVGVVRDESYFLNVKKIDVLTRHMATCIDREKKEVVAVDLELAVEKRFPYDDLVIATGGSPIKPDLPGIELGTVFTLWTLSDALAMRAAIDNGNVKRAVVVGAGLIGMEVVEALVARDIEVSVVDLLSWPLPNMLDEEFGSRLLRELKAKGVHFYGNEKVLEILGQDSVLTGVKTDQRTIPADMVLLAIGVRPNIHLAEETGLDIGSSGGVAVDEYMRTSDPNIYAGGDCVEVRHILTGKGVRQPMGSSANREGRVIADNILGRGSTFKGVLGTAIMKFFEYTVGRTGFNEHQARKEGFDPISVTVTAPDKPHFMPGAAWMVIKLVADKNTKRLLGGQIFGPGAVDKRLDGLVTAVTGGLTVDDLADTDFAYAPPYATALDPMTQTANVLRNKMEGLMTSYSPRELAAKMDRGEDCVLLDVRTEGEIKLQGKLPYENQVHIPLGALWTRVEELPKDKEIIAFCKISLRGWDALTVLRSKGFHKVAILEGGMMGWPYG
ncbi:FAD-dependent pyridine nucleotide-disulphide oxidoreductase [Dethiosulfovibrio peptidovorans DSM 11002]|uniref:FAD-dependent pyridine nucleotide-disulphide oxidoreductase n=1 Tax=Dethiosulfovibrio peptidovorans DSM 11002 TaxID=469381 RepID=D2Z6K9_9BACT|nr:FAD-dependent oxidoreductase [Dethiosulfovibrio peptidovorans]EFC91106.1 FAD-dependent pyridine nucleotide-disulphide oxidoreductase [Dethiosulfovibrio peptidovorans DSM 11002]